MNSIVSLIFSIIVIGGSEGAIATAVTAANNQHDVLLIHEHPIGGMSAVGVGTMDGNPVYQGSDVLESGFYKRFIDKVHQTYTTQTKTAYWEIAHGIPPTQANAVFTDMLDDAGVTVVQDKIDHVSILHNKLFSVHSKKAEYQGSYFVDASEQGTLLTLIDHPLNEYSCNQDITYAAVVKRHGKKIHAAPPHYMIDREEYKKIVTKDGHNTFKLPVSGDFFYRYRRFFNDHSALNWGNDGEFNDHVRAKYKTLSLLYYLQKDVGVDWGLADHGLGHNDLILPEGWREYESMMPGQPYYRQTISMQGMDTITIDDVNEFIKTQSPNSKFKDSIAVGDYGFDKHGCLVNGIGQLEGIKGVTYKALISNTYDNLMAGNGKLISTSEHANTLYRHQPISMGIGEAAGEAVSMAIETGVIPENIPVQSVQQRLINNGANLIPFTDVPLDHQYREQINLAAIQGITAGIGNWKFGPDLSLNRGTMAVFLHRALKLKTKKYRGDFKDVSNKAWYRDSVQTIYDEGITGGCGDGKFCPDGLVTRWQLNRFLERVGKSHIVDDSHTINATRAEIVSGLISNE